MALMGSVCVCVCVHLFNKLLLFKAAFIPHIHQESNSVWEGIICVPPSLGIYSTVHLVVKRCPEGRGHDAIWNDMLKFRINLLWVVCQLWTFSSLFPLFSLVSKEKQEFGVRLHMWVHSDESGGRRGCGVSHLCPIIFFFSGPILARFCLIPWPSSSLRWALPSLSVSSSVPCSK